MSESREQSPGSAAEEAVALVAALRELVSGPVAEHLSTGSAECQVCPICRGVAMLREADPASVGRAAEGLVAVIGAAASLAEPLVRSFVETAVNAAQEAATAWPATAGADPAGSTADATTEGAAATAADTAADAATRSSTDATGTEG